MAALDRDRFRVEVCALRGDENDMDSAVEELGGRVHRMRSTRRRDAASLAGLLKRNPFDVVHFQDHLGHGPLLGVAADIGVERRIFQFHSTNFPDAPNLLDRLRQRLRHLPERLRAIDHHATRIVACSRQVMASRWREDWHSDDRCRVIYNGIDVSPFRPSAEPADVRREFGIPENSPLCIHIGRPSRVKNYPRSFEIFRAIRGRFSGTGNPAPYLLIVGIDPRSATGRVIHRQAETRGVGAHTVWAGVRSDVPRLLKASDLMLLPSLFEGLPGAVIESCCAGTPVLTSVLSGVEEIRTQLPNAPISSLSLARSDEDWAAAGLRLLARPISEEDRSAALEAVSSSVFNIEAHTRELCTVWL